MMAIWNIIYIYIYINFTLVYKVDLFYLSCGNWDDEYAQVDFLYANL